MPEISKTSDKYRKEVSRNLLLLVDDLSDSVIVCNLDSIIKYCNKSTKTIHGYSKKELIGKHISILLADNNKNVINDVIDKIKNGNKVKHFETIMKKKNGIRFAVSISVSPLYGSNGTIIGVISVISDMTEKYNMINELIESEEKYKLAIESGNFGIWDWDIRTNKMYYSSRCKNMLGFEANEIESSYKEWYKRMHTEDLPGVMKKIKEKLNGEIYNVKYRLKCKDESYLWVQTIGKVIEWDYEGKPIRMIGTIADVNEDMLQRRKILESENRIRGIYDSINIGICLGELIQNNKDIPIDYRFLKINNAMGKIIGENTENFEKKFKSIYGHNENMLQIFSDVSLKGKNFKKEIYIKNSGKYFDINIYSPNPMQFAIVIVDITETKKNEKELSEKYNELSAVHEKLTVTEEELRNNYIELEEANEQTTKANQAKGQFLANMSHELRTPLNGILGFTQLLLLSNIDEEQKDELLMIEESSNHLLELINSILDLSKIEAGKIILNHNKFNIKEQMELIIKGINLMTENKNIEIMYYVDPFINEELTGDIFRLKQVLNNIISNAVKFTDSGHIYFKVKEISKTIDKIKLEFSVEDTGKGISDEFKNKIFDKFIQEEDTYTKNYGGTGLGLAISKQLVSLMGGSIWFESKIGKGSTFYFTAVFEYDYNKEQVHDKEIIKISKSNNTYKNILVAEDNEINLKIINAYLKMLNYKFVFVRNGQDAVDYAEKNKTDIILMDIQMPILNGLEAAKIIRDREKKTGEHQIIIAMTACAMEGDREKFIKAGMDDYISKPFNMETLNEKLRKW